MLEKYLREPRFKNVSKWLHLLINLNKLNRIAQRPLLVAISEVDKMFTNLREVGASNYFSYPEVAPQKKVISLTPVSDHTSYSTAHPFPLPSIPSVLHGCDVPPDQQAIIEDNWNSIMNLLKNYQVSVSDSFIDLYNRMADSTLKLDDFLTCMESKEVLYITNSDSKLGPFIFLTENIYNIFTKTKTSKSRANNSKDTSKNVKATTNPNNLENTTKSVKMEIRLIPK